MLVPGVVKLVGPVPVIYAEANSCEVECQDPVKLYP